MITSATVFVAPLIGAARPDREATTCGLCCGSEPCRDADKVLKSGFTNRDELDTPMVCWACEACLADRSTRSSLLAHDGKIRKLERREVWPLLISPPEPPFVLYWTLSGQKHGLFRQRVADSRDIFRVQCEDRGGDFYRPRSLPWMRAASELVLAKVSRDSMETGNYSSGDYAAAGEGFISDREKLIWPHRSWPATESILSIMPGVKDLPGVMPLFERSASCQS